MGSYAEFLKTDLWKTVSEERKRLDGMSCVCCGGKENLDAHHVIYPKRWDDTTTDHLVTLCHDCHLIVHRIQEAFDHVYCNSGPELSANGFMLENERRDMFYKAVWYILAEECWRRNVFASGTIGSLCRALINVALEKSQRVPRAYTPTTGAIERLLALVKDCYIANPSPKFSMANRKYRHRSKTKFKR